MGQLTRKQIVYEGLLAAGDLSLTTRANFALNQRLRSEYAAWLWPFLLKEKPGLSLGTGVQTMTVGAGQGWAGSPAIHSVRDPIFFYDSVFSTRQVCRIRSMLSDDITVDEDANDATKNRGLPNLCKVRPTSTWGQWDLVFNRAADKAYLFKLFYKYQPDDIDTTSAGDSTTPIYPNDKTMIQMVKAWALGFKKSKEAGGEATILGMMIADDRLKYTDVPGINDSLGLDPKTYR